MPRRIITASYSDSRARSRAASRSRSPAAGVGAARDEGAIAFFGAANPHGFLSNFYPCSFALDGSTFVSVEQYFQALKARRFGDDAALAEIMKTSNPGSAKSRGRQVQNFAKDVWDAEREGVMLAGLRAKFGQDAALRGLLLATGSAPLVENAPRDYFWGVGARRTGKNALGVLLARVRAELRAELRTALEAK